MNDELKLSGQQPSYQMDNQLYYSTNFGQVIVDINTKELVSCCIGIGRNQFNTPISIKICDNEFSITKDHFNLVYAELCSTGWEHPKNCKDKISVLEVLNILYKDDNCSIAAIIVKKELIRLIRTKLKLTNQELVELNRLLSSWRKPIITRTPIITGGK